MTTPLVADELVERALRGEAAERLGADDWQEGLDVFVRSANHDARLHPGGLAMAGASAVGRLRARLATKAWFESHPERSGARPASPVFIVGGWRTGTTFLQRLLAESPSLRALHPWELGAPWKAAEADDELQAKLIARAQIAHDRLHERSPELQHVHDSGAELPEECVLALGTTMRNWGFLSTMRLSTYAEWLFGQDFAAEYEAYAQVLAMLDRTDGRRFVLKAPAHTAELPSLLRAFPDATVVQLHRDVVEMVASGASLFTVFRSIYSDEVDPVEVGEFQARTTLGWFERAMAFRDACEREGVGRFVDVAYTDLVADPLATARRIHEAAGLVWDEPTRALLDRQLGRRESQPHRRHVYTPEEFGLDPADLLTRFARYRERYGVL